MKRRIYPLILFVLVILCNISNISASPTSQPSSQPSNQPTVQPSGRPSLQPSSSPTSQPFRRPTSQPSSQPTEQPSGQPSMQPTIRPSVQPSARPSAQPSNQPSGQPSTTPTQQPTMQPSGQPSHQPTNNPTNQSSQKPSSQPSVQPSSRPSAQPSRQPTSQPSIQPTVHPSGQPTSQPSRQPSAQPSASPSAQPTSQPSFRPSNQPSTQPSGQPSVQPSSRPSQQPTAQPSRQPSAQPSVSPSAQPTSQPSARPSAQPSGQPSRQPSAQPSLRPSGQPTTQPSKQPSAQPSVSPSAQPTSQPSRRPSVQPSMQPTMQPTSQPSGHPTSQPSARPTLQPSRQPSAQPSFQPSMQPTVQPSNQPVGLPTSRPSTQPSRQPTTQPSVQPSGQPSAQPNSVPSAQPSAQPSHQPSAQPSAQPTEQPTNQPSAQPSRQPSVQPSNQPSAQPSVQPTSQPSAQPSSGPTTQPSQQPTKQPSAQPSGQPSSQPVLRPTSRPSTQPSGQPSTQPTSQPSKQPSSQPTNQPSSQPSEQPSAQPSAQPNVLPTSRPSSQPSRQPSMQPSRQPSSRPTSQPSAAPSRIPSGQPSTQPSKQPVGVPSSQPSTSPTAKPNTRPSAQPSGQPSTQPYAHPSSQPSSQPTAQPSSQPVLAPTSRPSAQPSSQPSAQPVIHPTSRPTSQPSSQPSAQPRGQPSFAPSAQPFSSPSAQPSSQPSTTPTQQPVFKPTSFPSAEPSGQPSKQPSSQPSAQPSRQPVARPTGQPTSQPSRLPSSQPVAQPSGQPSSQPTMQPSGQPVAHPSSQPSAQPVAHPSAQPSVQPSVRPTGQPSRRPSNQPSGQPSASPSHMPTSVPTSQPSEQPSSQPSCQPASAPSAQPSKQPSSRPSGQPSRQPSTQPTSQPSARPSSQPTMQPTRQPSAQPSSRPSSQPILRPTSRPSSQPSSRPSMQPTIHPSGQPSAQPISKPSSQPSSTPSSQPSGQPNAHPSTQPSAQPSEQPSGQPVGAPSAQPSELPSSQPSAQPVQNPTSVPTGQPTSLPSTQPSSQPSGRPTCQPQSRPSAQPSTQPSAQPTIQPFGRPSSRPSAQPQSAPSAQPSVQPTMLPTTQPSGQPSQEPTSQPSTDPSAQPVAHPTSQPSSQPSSQPTSQPFSRPSAQPTVQPSSSPSTQPSSQPSARPSKQPTSGPTGQPTNQPSSRPSGQPSAQPSRQPSQQPFAAPSSQPTMQPSCRPSQQPTSQPTVRPSAQPLSSPSSQPSSKPSGQPSAQPSGVPSGQPSGQPSKQPSSQPSAQPSKQPTSQPTTQPSGQPTVFPTSMSTGQPSSQPSRQPTTQPSSQPSAHPSRQPSTQPSEQPSVQPTGKPSKQPSADPTTQPSCQPSGQPSATPTVQPSRQPSAQPSARPTGQPSCQPSSRPSSQPSVAPSRQPSAQPSRQPSGQPSVQPSSQPSSQPSTQPSARPSSQPSSKPSGQPSLTPSNQPSSQPSGQPSNQPTRQPTSQPSAHPSSQPSERPSAQPTAKPSAQPSTQPSSHPSTQPSMQPTSQPSQQPSSQPSSSPSAQPSGLPTSQPSQRPSSQPSTQPSSRPSQQPSTQPTRLPTGQPTAQPSQRPSAQPSGHPSPQPSSKPSTQPTSQPSCEPSGQPSGKPSMQPSRQPSSLPTQQPSAQPSSHPTGQPVSFPTAQPSMQPTSHPSAQPSVHPSSQPSVQPSAIPSSQPSLRPSSKPTCQPTSQPSCEPSSQPSTHPSSQPTIRPSSRPTQQPIAAPTGQPSIQPSSRPSGQPSVQPTQQPSAQPSGLPSAQPSLRPSLYPSSQPTSRPSSQPSEQPSSLPTSQPSSHPSGQPTEQPSSHPSGQPTMQPTGQPSSQPSRRPSSQPTAQPSMQPSGQPTSDPSGQPTMQPSMIPSAQPSSAPSAQPSVQPSALPTTQPSMQPSRRPSGQPSKQPSCQPSSQPSTQPSSQPTSHPTTQPSSQPSSAPSSQPSIQPSGKPSAQPSSQPSMQPSTQPTMQPSMQPSMQPTGRPTTQPSTQPSSQPSSQPSMQPSVQPSGQPSGQPSSQPTLQPSGQPSQQPSHQPSSQPSAQPSIQPSSQPSDQPSTQPSSQPSVQPSSQPSMQPSAQPSSQPSMQPTSQPSAQPSVQPSGQPTMQPSGQPSSQPSDQPSVQPTMQPTVQPSAQPSAQPTMQPNDQPSMQPSGLPSMQPTSQPSSQPSRQPSSHPSQQPSSQPSAQPSAQPSTQPSLQPSAQPSMQPSAQPTMQPSRQPSAQPSMQPSGQPSTQPSSQPSIQPSTQPSGQPSSQPSMQPSCQPTTQPTMQPSIQPSGQPSGQPSQQPSHQPSAQPSARPSGQPTSQPSRQPSGQPTRQPSAQPSAQPSSKPSCQPTMQPTMQPSGQPTALPSMQPTSQPTMQPSAQPSGRPTMQPSSQPSSLPTGQPSIQPSKQPSSQPSSRPTMQPSRQPSARPSGQPSRKPSAQPTRQPSSRPTKQPTSQPSRQPSRQPSSRPTGQPSRQPSRQPSGQPSRQPSRQPSGQPSGHPSGQPSVQPTAQPTTQPSGLPSTQPSSVPSGQPSTQPSQQPTTQPSSQPSMQPSSQPSHQPSNQPSTQPSAQPTVRPTSSRPTGVPSGAPSKAPTTTAPTRPGDTNKPSAQPTSSPSIMLSNYESQRSYVAYRQTQREYRNTSRSFTFGNYYYKGQAIDGTCQGWNSLIQDSLTFPFEDIYFASVSTSYYVDNFPLSTYTEYSATCRDANIVAQLISNLRSGGTFQVNCGDHSWRVFTCNNHPVLCVNCKLTCVKTESCPGRSYTINPCYSDCTTRIGAGAAVNFQYANRIFYPLLSAPFTYAPARQSIAITVNASAPGNIYCAAFSVNTTIASVLTIRSAGSSAFVTTPRAVTLTLSGLSPDTLYDTYCYSEDFASHVMPLVVALQTRKRVRTVSCKALELTQGHSNIVQYFVSNANPEPIFQFLVNSRPLGVLTVSLGVRTCVSANVANDAIVTPSVLTFTQDSPVLVGSFAVRGTVTGCYVVTATASSAVDRYSGFNTTLTIRNFRLLPITPVPLTATFSSEGTKLSVIFDSPTNRADSILSAPSFAFACSMLLSFPGSATALCLWMSSTELVASFVGSTNLPVVGSSVSVLPNVVRALCLISTDCTVYPFVTSTTLSLQAPVNAISPTVLLRSASTVGSCDNIVLDPQGSTGFAGRAWSALSWSVSGTASSLNNTAIAAYLNANLLNTFSTGTVPNRLLTPSKRYVFILTLTNFLGKVNVGQTTVDVSEKGFALPHIQIVGPASVSSRWKPVNLFVNSTFPVCVRSNNIVLAYTWKVYKGYTFTDAVTSTSLDARYFKLDPFTLDAAAQYTFQVTATVVSGTYDGDVRAVSTTHTLQLGTSDVVARIRGASTVTSVVSRAVTLDASTSSDPDYPDASAALLSFQWSCAGTSATLGVSCNSYISDASLATIVLPASTVPVGNYNFTVLVSNSRGSVQSASVQLQVINKVVPAVSISSVEAKYNPQSKIILTGSVVAVGSSAVAVWSSSGIATTSLSLMAGTDLSKEVQSGAPILQLSLRAYSLSPGQTYTFTLQAAYAGSSDSAAASVLIVINAPPANGVVTSNPSTGTALTTQYFITTSQWTDDSADYPFTYLLAYYTVAAANFKIIKDSDQVSFTRTVLGQGMLPSGYAVTLLAQVADFFGSTANTTTGVIVTPVVVNSALSTSTATALSVAATNKNPTTTNQLVSAALTSLDAVDCRVPRSCISLNRVDCQSTALTCGACLPGYAGVEGDSNVACKVPTTLVAVGAVCTTGSACLSGICASGRCADASKVCPNNCNNRQGRCVFTDNFNNVLQNCTVSNALCRANCVCSENWFGRDCALSQARIAVALDFRETLCNSLYTSLAVQDVSAETVSARARSIADMFLDMAQVSDRAFQLCAAVLVDTVTTHRDLACQGTAAPFIVKALSNALQRGYLSQVFVGNVSQVLNVMTANCHTTLAINDAPLTILTENVRVTTRVSTKAALMDSNYSLPIARSEAEFFSGVSPSSVSVNATHLETGEALGISLVQFNNNPTGARSNSTGLSVQLNTYPAVSAGSVDFTSSRRRLQTTTVVGVEVELINTYPIQYTRRNISTIQVKCITPRNVPYEVLGICPGNISVPVSCPVGVKGTFHITCSGYENEAVCTSLQGNVYVVDASCRVVDRTDKKTVCYCESSASSTRRQLQESLSAVTYASELVQTNIPDRIEFVEFPVLREPGNAQVLLSALSVLAVVFILGLMSILSCCVYSRVAANKNLKIAVAKDSDMTRPKRTLDKFFDSLLPTAFRNPEASWRVVFPVALWAQHSLLRLFSIEDATNPSDNNARQSALQGYNGYKIFAILTHLMAKLLTFVFFDSLLAYLAYPYDSSCRAITVQSECDSQQSFRDLHQACAWSERSESCSYRGPGLRIFDVLFYAALVLAASVLYNRLLEWIFSQAFVRLALFKEYLFPTVVEIDLQSALSLLTAEEAVLKGQSEKVTSVNAKNGFKDNNVLTKRALKRAVSDEFQSYGKQRLVMWQAARLTKISAVTEFNTPAMEAAVVQAAYEFRRSKARSAAAAAFYGQIELTALPNRYETQYTASTGRPSKHNDLAVGIHVAREQANSLLKRLLLTPTDEEREKLLVWSLVNDAVDPRYHHVTHEISVRENHCNAHTFAYRETGRSYISVLFSLLLIACVPAHFLGLGYLVYLCDEFVVADNATMWGVVLALSVGQYFALIECVLVFLRDVMVVHQHVGAAVHAQLRRVGRRARLVLMRSAGLMRDAHALVQHLNPACRAARRYPALPVARMLLSLADSDLTGVSEPLVKEVPDQSVKNRFNLTWKQSRRNFNRFYEAVCCAPMLLFAFVPYRVAELLCEICGLIVLNVLIFGLYFAGAYDRWTTVIVVSIVVGLILLVIVVVEIVRFRASQQTTQERTLRLQNQANAHFFNPNSAKLIHPDATPSSAKVSANVSSKLAKMSAMSAKTRAEDDKYTHALSQNPSASARVQHRVFCKDATGAGHVILGPPIMAHRFHASDADELGNVPFDGEQYYIESIMRQKYEQAFGREETDQQQLQGLNLDALYFPESASRKRRQPSQDVINEWNVSHSIENIHAYNQESNVEFSGAMRDTHDAFYPHDTSPSADNKTNAKTTHQKGNAETKKQRTWFDSIYSFQHEEEHKIGKKRNDDEESSMSDSLSEDASVEAKRNKRKKKFFDFFGSILPGSIAARRNRKYAVSPDPARKQRRNKRLREIQRQKEQSQQGDADPNGGNNESKQEEPTLSNRFTRDPNVIAQQKESIRLGKFTLPHEHDDVIGTLSRQHQYYTSRQQRRVLHNKYAQQVKERAPARPHPSTTITDPSAFSHFRSDANNSAEINNFDLTVREAKAKFKALGPGRARVAGAVADPIPQIQAPLPPELRKNTPLFHHKHHSHYGTTLQTTALQKQLQNLQLGSHNGQPLPVPTNDTVPHSALDLNAIPLVMKPTHDRNKNRQLGAEPSLSDCLLLPVDVAFELPNVLAHLDVNADYSDAESETNFRADLLAGMEENDRNIQPEGGEKRTQEQSEVNDLWRSMQRNQAYRADHSKGGRQRASTLSTRNNAQLGVNMDQGGITHTPMNRAHLHVPNSSTNRAVRQLARGKLSHATANSTVPGIATTPSQLATTTGHVHAERTAVKPVSPMNPAHSHPNKITTDVTLLAASTKPVAPAVVTVSNEATSSPIALTFDTQRQEILPERVNIVHSRPNSGVQRSSRPQSGLRPTSSTGLRKTTNTTSKLRSQEGVSSPPRQFISPSPLGKGFVGSLMGLTTAKAPLPAIQAHTTNAFDLQQAGNAKK